MSKPPNQPLFFDPFAIAGSPSSPQEAVQARSSLKTRKPKGNRRKSRSAAINLVVTDLANLRMRLKEYDAPPAPDGKPSPDLPSPELPHLLNP
ncbi:hypothetical protein SAMN05660916_02262 [Arthrobacter sp. 31Cvi3.1E]|nr:hypothetical protein SAMN05660916_02262 [Arthrobacter sp. 31Cvi3.1E]